MILLQQNQNQKFVLTLNELSNPAFQKIKWRIVFKLEQVLGDDNYSKTVVLTDLNGGNNRRYNEFEIDSSIFEIIGDYQYTAYQIDENEKDIQVVEVGKMRIFEENQVNEYPIDSNTLIYG